MKVNIYKRHRNSYKQHEIKKWEKLFLALPREETNITQKIGEGVDVCSGRIKKFKI